MTVLHHALVATGAVTWLWFAARTVARAVPDSRLRWRFHAHRARRRAGR